MKDTTLTWDVETASATELYTRTPEQFFRLGGYAWGDGPVHITSDLEEMREVVRSADRVIGHNQSSFDLPAIFGVDSLEPLQMALDDRVYDTWVDAPVVFPYPDRYTNRFGAETFISSTEAAMRFYKLDELAYQLGTVRKTDDIKDLAKKHGGYDLIPLDDEEYREYLVGDVIATREVAKALLARGPWTDYRVREQRVGGIISQISRNGIYVDQDFARERLATLEARKEEHLTSLQTHYGVPTTGKSPLSTKEGKAALFQAMEDLSIPVDRLELTATGNPSLGGSSLMLAAEGVSEEAEQFAQSVALIKGTRLTVQNWLDNVQPDGRVHPDITALQRSARLSFKNPGVTVMGARGEAAIDRRVAAASPGYVMVEMDFQAADTRAVAAYSGDGVFYEEFVKGDAHTLAAEQVWGPMEPGPDGKHPYRQTAKGGNHSSAYRVGPGKLAKMMNVPEKTARAFLENQVRRYRKRAKWQDETTRQGEKGFVMNAWGRALPVQKDRAYTQSCAQLGQNATREMVFEGLLKLPAEYMRFVVAIIHDALLLEFPEDRADELIGAFEEAFDAEFSPPGGITVPFPMVAGRKGANWMEASH